MELEAKWKLMQKIDELYPTWQKVSMTKKGYIEQRERVLTELSYYIRDISDES